MKNCNAWEKQSSRKSSSYQTGKRKWVVLIGAKATKSASSPAKLDFPIVWQLVATSGNEYLRNSIVECEKKICQKLKDSKIAVEVEARTLSMHICLLTLACSYNTWRFLGNHVWFAVYESTAGNKTSLTVPAWNGSKRCVHVVFTVFLSICCRKSKKSENPLLHPQAWRVGASAREHPPE